jgi:hypothetical protein
MLEFISGFLTGAFLSSAGFVYLCRRVIKRVLDESSGADSK